MRIDAIAFTTAGCRTALRVRDALPDDDVRLHCRTSSDSLGIEDIGCGVGEWTGRSFAESDALVFIGSTGIAVRCIAPFIRGKDRDPAVVCMDERGRHTIALLSGHIGGCNELATRIADGIGSEPVITTATDIEGRFSVDAFATRNGMRISSLDVAKAVSARVLDGGTVGFRSDIPVEGGLPDGLVETDSGDLGVAVSACPGRGPFVTTLWLVPMDIAVGVGCRRGTDPVKLHDFVCGMLEEDGISPDRVAEVSSIDLKKSEEAVLRLARSLGSPAVFYTAEDLNSIEGEFSGSAFVAETTGVDCVCERSALMGGGELIRRKTAEDGMTIAFAKRTIRPRFV